ncbi:MAG TPA: FkbM family methyltransferase [Mycobacterium sp.]
MRVRSYSSEFDWRLNLVNELTAHEVDAVLDVGANSGQYATCLRQADFNGRIISFEPLSGPFSRLAARSSADPLWDCRQCALGDFDGTIAMNVAGNAGASSSILPMLQSHRDVFPQANYVGAEDVAIRRLDSAAPEILRHSETVFLKIDVQGFDRQVIAGAESTINDHCTGIQLELSFAALYEGDMVIHEALDLMDSLGFVLAGLAPGFTDVRNGRVLQADGVFFRAQD